MEFFKPGTRYDFLGKARPFLLTSLVLVVVSWGLVLTKGLNFGIDFAGGTEALLAFNEPVDTKSVEASAKAIGLETVEVVKYGIGDSYKFFVRSRTQSLLSQAEKDKVKAAVTAKVGAPELWDDSDESGEEIRVRFDGTKSEADLKAALADADFPNADVGIQARGAKPVYLLRMPSVRQRLIGKMQADFGEKFNTVERMESVGSAVGAQMRNQGVLAVLYALIGILIYVSFRFDLRYSPGAVIALMHDVSLTVGIYSLLGLEFSLPIIAALLAIVGYSLNDTIVVYDRIRESIKQGIGKGLWDTVNISINDCLSRTILTSLTTFVAVLAIYIFGGGIIQNFAFAMLVGVVVGTYSSIYIASPAVLFMDTYLAARAAVAATRPARGASRS